MVVYDTVTEALDDLKSKGFNTDFNIAFDSIKCAETGVCLSPAAFEITSFYRFEGNNDPDDSAILYVIESKDGSMKGTLLSAYGAYSEAMSEDMIKKLSMKHDG